MKDILDIRSDYYTDRALVDLDEISHISIEQVGGWYLVIHFKTGIFDKIKYSNREVLLNWYEEISKDIDRILTQRKSLLKEQE